MAKLGRAAGIFVGFGLLVDGQKLKELLLMFNALTACGFDTLRVRLATSEFGPALLMEIVQKLIAMGSLLSVTLGSPGMGDRLQAGSIFNTGASAFLMPLVRPMLMEQLSCRDVDPDV